MARALHPGRLGRTREDSPVGAVPRVAGVSQDEVPIGSAVNDAVAAWWG